MARSMPYRVSHRRKQDPVITFLAFLLGTVILAAVVAIYVSQSALRDVMIEEKRFGIAVADRFIDTDKLRRSKQEKWEPVLPKVQPAKPGEKLEDALFPADEIVEPD